MKKKITCKSLLEVNSEVTLPHPAKQGDVIDTISLLQLNWGRRDVNHLLKQ